MKVGRKKKRNKEEQQPPGLREVGQLHAHIRMVRLEGEEEVEEEEEDEPSRGSQEARPVQGPDHEPVQQRRVFEIVASFLGRQLGEQEGGAASNESYVHSEAPTDDGSLEGSYEDDWIYECLSDSEYEEYRMNMIREGIGITVSLVEKLRMFRQMERDNPNDEAPS